MGRAAEGVAELRAVLDANPSFTGARANLGLALYRAGDLDAAQAEWERCLAQQPGARR
jgi:tetratricopeptide (TPR) repeat protein